MTAARTPTSRPRSRKTAATTPGSSPATAEAAPPPASLPVPVPSPVPVSAPAPARPHSVPAAFGGDMMRAWWDYSVDVTQRSILFWDVLRRRGNDFLEHRKAGLPPVLDFEYDLVLDGRDLERPVNYALLRILPRPGDVTDMSKRPYVVVDPRAGHGPGIGGAKQDSQVGVALSAGHPVYFITFHPEPCPGQTILDVKSAKARFLEEIAHRHPQASGKPVVVGNCQAGWSVMIVGAARPEVTGPIIVNGAPLAYWAGVEGKNPMRYRGGLYGGTWLASMASDLGDGVFDGANLVSNFETLNPANTLWTKQYNLFARPDEEADRYLQFERWWGGFFLMTQEEMEFIVDNLFVGNKLGRGGVRLEDGRDLDLRNIESPMVVFASAGDNITPPQQALLWIADLYESAAEIRDLGKTIVYLLHADIGHLGIFVSGKVAQKEHAEIVGVLEYLEMLPPGLYEMVIDAHAEPDMHEIDPSGGRFEVRFEPREIDDILAMGGPPTEDQDFATVDRVSRMNADLYKRFVRPAVRAMSTPQTAAALREMHPLRLQRSLLSDLNPFLWPLKPWADAVQRNRRKVEADNPYVRLEHTWSDWMEKTLNAYRDRRDANDERTFKAIYGANGLARMLPKMFPDPASVKAEALTAEAKRELAASKLPAFDAGGAAAGMVRVVAAVLMVGGKVDRREFVAGANILKSSPHIPGMTLDRFRTLFAQQSALLRADEGRALAALPTLLDSQDLRMEAMVAAHSVAMADFALSEAEQAIVAKIGRALGI